MDVLKFAQFDRSPCKARLDFLKQVEDINYTIPNGDSSTGTITNRAIGGYTFLHSAATHSDIYSVRHLLKRGADFTKQSTFRGTTPLHCAIEHSWNLGKKILNVYGELDVHPMVDILLSAHLDSNVSKNPKNKNGMSHLHIACMYNEAEVVEFFLKHGASVDEAVNKDSSDLAGFTPLHFTVRYSSPAAAEILLKYGADACLKDITGISPLHLAIQRKIEMSDFMKMGQRVRCWQFENEIEKLDSIIKFIMTYKNMNDPSSIDDMGLSVFHVVCTLKDKSYAEEFLKQSLDINAAVEKDLKFWPGFTALHFAAYCNVDIVKLLVQKGANLMTKNAEGKTALDLCIGRYPLEEIHSILSMQENYKDVLLSDGTTTLLDMILAMKDCDSFTEFLKNKPVGIHIPVDSPILPGCSPLHIAVMSNEKTKDIQEFLDATDYNDFYKDLPKEYNCRKGDKDLYYRRIELCLKHGMKVTLKNADCQSPVHLAFYSNKTNIVKRLLDCNKSGEDNPADSNDLSHLHIACTVNKKNLVKRLIRKHFDVNVPIKTSFVWYTKEKKEVRNDDEFDEEDEEGARSPKSYPTFVRAHSTALHLALIFKENRIIEILAKHQANVNAKDSKDLTPVHLILPFMNNHDSLAQILLKATDFQDSVTRDGLSYLHVAAFANNDRAIEKLLEQGADIESTLNISAGDAELSHLEDYIGLTPLQIAVNCKAPDAVKALIQKGANIYAKNPRGLNALEYAMENFHLDFVKHFIAVLKRDKHRIKPIDETGLTMLHIACARFDLSEVEKLLKEGANVNAIVRGNENIPWFACTPLCVLISEIFTLKKCPRNSSGLVDLLLKHGADVTIKCKTLSPVLMAYRRIFIDEEEPNDDEEEPNDDDDSSDDSFGEDIARLSIADTLLHSQKSYTINPIDSYGFSHFHFACLRNDHQNVLKFLQSGIDVNLAVDPFSSEYGGYTALHFAASHPHGRKLVEILIKHNANVRARDTSGDTPLHVAIKEASRQLDLFDLLLSNGADINAKNQRGETPLELILIYAISNLDLIKLFLNRGSRVHPVNPISSKGIIGTAMQRTEIDRRIIFKMLIEACDMDNQTETGPNAIHSIVAVHQDGELTVDLYIEAIEELTGLGCDLDQQDSKGLPPLFIANSYLNIEAMKALLMFGADFNITDKSGRTCFDEYAVVCDDVTDREKVVAQLMAESVWKSLHLGLKVCKHNKETYDIVGEKMPINENIKTNCQKELIEMENTRICQVLTVRDFLHPLGGVVDYPTISPVHRESVDNYFKSARKVNEKFPELGGLLMMQYKKAVKRTKWLEDAKNTLISIGCKLPHLCLESILRYFENEELEKLIEANTNKSEGKNTLPTKDEEEEQGIKMKIRKFSRNIIKMPA